MKNTFLALVLFLFCTGNVVAQQLHTVKGVVLNQNTNFPLVGAQVYILDSSQGVITNNKGEFLFSLPKGTFNVEFSYLGFETMFNTFSISKDTIVNIQLVPTSINLQTVKVTTTRADANVSSIEVNKTELTQEGIKSIPAIMGEPDVVRALASKGGVRQMEGVQGMSVRGGSQDQNLILFDKAVVYNPSHLLGFFSVFPSEVIGNASLYKSSIPAKYGGRLSSVLDIESANPRKDSIQASLSLGVLSSRAMFSTPLDSKSAIRVSYRKTYLNLFVMPIINEVLQNSEQLSTEFGFSDATIRYNYKANQNNTLNVSAYFGSDKFTMKNNVSLLNNNVQWGNSLISAWWTHKHNDKSIQSFGFSQSKYEFDFSAIQNYYEIDILTSIVNRKWFFNNKLLHSNYKINYGFECNNTDYNSGTINAIIDGEPIDNINPLLSQSVDFSLYGEFEYKINDRFVTKFIGRIVPTAQIGPNTFYEYNDENIIIDSTVYKWYNILYSTIGWEPRVQANYTINKENSIKAAISRTNQYLHKVSMLSAALPADIWLPITKETPAPYGMTYSVGYFSNFKENMYQTSFSLFYKSMNNLIEFKDGFITLYSDSFNNKLAKGKGFASGAEVVIRKEKGKLQGSLAYSFSRTLRKFDEINDNILYPASYDKPHDFSLQLQYPITEKLKASALFVWSSGKVYSEPVSRYFINKNLINEYGPINNSRMPNYNRLDVGLEYLLYKKNAFDMSIQLSAYNVYNRNNSYYIFYETIANLDKFSIDMNKTYVGLFPILPSVSIIMNLR